MENKKIQIKEISVLNIEYKGAISSDRMLEKGCRYTAVVIEGVKDNGGVLILRLQNAKIDEMEYASFVSFAMDWDIMSYFSFPESFIPPKSA